MKRKFTANILFLIGINILIKPFYALAIDTSVQNIVGTEAYGLFLAIFNLVYIQQVFADLGIQNYNNRDISRDPEKLPQILSKVLASKILFTLFFIGITILTTWIFGYSEYFGDIVIWVIGSQAALSMLLYLRTNVSGSGRYFTDSFFSVLDKLILIIWMSYVIWGNPTLVDITISYFVKVQFISLVLTAFFVIVFTHKRLAKVSLSFNLEFIKELLKESLPYATLVLLMAGYSRLDGLMLEQLINDNAAEAGEYARSFRLYDTYCNFAFLFAVLLLPMFSSMLKKGEKVNEIVEWAFRLLALGSIFTIVMVYFEGASILHYFYEVDKEEVPLTLILLMSAGLSLSLNYIYGTLLTANGKIKTLNKIAIFGFILNIGLNWMVIPKYGKEGAAFTTLLTQTFVLLVQMYYCYRFFDLEKLTVPIGKLALIALVTGFGFYGIQTLTSTHFLINIVLVGILCLAMAFLVKLIRPKDFKMVQ